MMALAFRAADVNFLVDTYVGPAAGPWTEMLCQEIAAHVVSTSACGMAGLYGACGAKMANVDRVTGMEARMLVEIADAAAGMGLKEANEVTGRLLARVLRHPDRRYRLPGQDLRRMLRRRGAQAGVRGVLGDPEEGPDEVRSHHLNRTITRIPGRTVPAASPARGGRSAPSPAALASRKGGEMDVDSAIETLPAGEPRTARDRLKALCLEKCDEITCEGYAFPERMGRANWIAIGLVTLAAGILAWAGYLL